MTWRHELVLGAVMVAGSARTFSVIALVVIQNGVLRSVDQVSFQRAAGSVGDDREENVIRRRAERNTRHKSSHLTGPDARRDLANEVACVNQPLWPFGLTAHEPR